MPCASFYCFTGLDFYSKLRAAFSPHAETQSMTVQLPLQVTGIYKGDWSQVYGMSFLVFNTDDKIQEVLTLMQPFPAQRKGLLKREE